MQGGNKYLIGIQPTGKLHIGNYLGCIKKALELQAEGNEVIFLIANYHAETNGLILPTQLKIELKKLGAKNIVEQHKEHLKLFWTLLCKTKMSDLERMTQYKDKKEKLPNVGLFTYPVLMAADIILLNSDYVIVGEDQLQHLELTNTLAKRMGIQKEYKYVLSETPRIMSLVDPTKKMSKSLGDKHVLYLFDENYEEKLKKAVTTPEGIKNLQKIGDALKTKKSDMYSAYKHNIAQRMFELFG